MHLIGSGQLSSLGVPPALHNAVQVHTDNLTHMDKPGMLHALGCFSLSWLNDEWVK